MNTEKIKLYNGFWNGEAAKYRIILGKVAPTPQKITENWKEKNGEKRRFVWYEMFVGKPMEMIEVHYNNIIWYINNSDGKGFNKVTLEMGSPKYGHKGLYCDEIFGDISPDSCKKYSEKKEIKLNKSIDDFFLKKEPFLYPKHQKEFAELLKAIDVVNKARTAVNHDKKESNNPNDLLN